MRLSLLISMLLILPACSSSTIEAGPAHAGHADHDELELDLASVSPEAVARVLVLQNETMSCPTEALGTVDVHEEMKSEDQALSLLKRRAAALGAEAVVGVEFHHGEGGGEATHLSGMAVRCQDLIQGRPYEVIGTIDMAGEMGHEEEAFEALRERGRALHADLIIGVHFEHGEGEGKPTHVSGKAIQFRPADSLPAH